ncbi:MAG: zinc-binding dehydrogenase [Hyphomonadaceae bacterium]
MKAIYLTPGPAGGVFEMREAEKPAPPAGGVVVRVRATGLNRGELLFVGNFRSDNPALKPQPSGIEFAGEIAEIGAGVSGWRVGDRVMGRAPASYAEYVAAPAGQLMRAPEKLSWAELAAIPNVFVTAHDAIATAGALKPGETVLVTAGASGVGTASIRLAKFLKAGRVVATTRKADKAAGLKALGADDVIDVSKPDWPDAVMALTDKKGADLIVDSVGGPMLAGNVKALALQGRLVSVGRNGGNTGDCDLDQVAFKRASIIGVTFRTRTPQEAVACAQRFADDCLAALADGRLKPALDKAFAFDKLAEAHAYMRSDGQIGKIVLTLD